MSSNLTRRRFLGAGVAQSALFAGAALLANLSFERGSVVRWNPEEMKLA
jgi:hypothetical protein